MRISGLLNIGLRARHLAFVEARRYRYPRILETLSPRSPRALDQGRDKERERESETYVWPSYI